MPTPRVAIVGGGVGACSLVYGMRSHLAANKISISLIEMGRGPGGRAATRTTRENKALRIDHGAPAFAAHTDSFAALCDSLTEFGALVGCGSTPAFGVLQADGTFVAEDANSAPKRYRAAEGKGMSVLCDALLRGGDINAEPLCDLTFGTMVSRVDCTSPGGQWSLVDKKGAELGDDFDWLVVTSTALAHPRWRSTFGGEPPLVQAATKLGDGALDATLASLAPLTSKPVTACLLAYEGEAAAAWSALPFAKTVVEEDEVLSRIVVQRVAPSLTAVALHSTHDFARSASHVYGKTSTAARLAGAASDEQLEAELLDTMLAAAERRLSGMLGATHVRSAAWGPHLHRWGAAFPDAPLLPIEQAIVPSARVAFCGDYIAGERAGTVEGAALSGLHTAEALEQALGLCNR